MCGLELENKATKLTQIKMPLEFVCSNAGQPMLLVNRRAFHKHSTNPKTGRKYWKCSRRRVKDVRCPSSCHTYDDYGSEPTPHDPNCLPLTNAELSAYENRKPRLSLMCKLENVTDSFVSNNNSINKSTGMYNDTYNGDSFQDNPDNELDEEEMILNGLESSINNNTENEDINDRQEPASIDSIIKDITVPDANQANSANFRPILPKPAAQNSQNEVSVNDYKKQTGNGMLKFITSKVGHPMLVVDDYSFHKHSVNPKTGRINWRCSRRRVKDIRCPSSCYTDNDFSSIPTPHHVNCYPMSAPPDFAMRKRQTPSRSQFADNNGHMNGEFEETMEDYENFDTTNDFCDSDNMPFNKTNQQLDYTNGYSHHTDEFDNHSDGLDYPASDDKPEDDYLFATGDYPHSDHTNEAFTEYDPSNYSTDPESFAKLIADLNDMKRRERMYREKLSNSEKEIDRIKSIAMKTIQTLKWKSRMSEIDLFSLKSSLQHTNTQNSNLRKLVDEMMSKVGS